jgi:hypothetical protein
VAVAAATAAAASSGVAGRRSGVAGSAANTGGGVWEAQPARLIAYQAEHGDCNVPGDGAEDKRLGKWVEKQRTHKKKLDRGEPSLGMTAARVTTTLHWTATKTDPATRCTVVWGHSSSPLPKAACRKKPTWGPMSAAGSAQRHGVEMAKAEAAARAAAAAKAAWEAAAVDAHAAGPQAEADARQLSVFDFVEDEGEDEADDSAEWSPGSGGRTPRRADDEQAVETKEAN